MKLASKDSTINTKDIRLSFYLLFKNHDGIRPFDFDEKVYAGATYDSEIIHRCEIEGCAWHEFEIENNLDGVAFDDIPVEWLKARVDEKTTFHENITKAMNIAGHAAWQKIFKRAEFKEIE